MYIAQSNTFTRALFFLDCTYICAIYLSVQWFSFATNLSVPNVQAWAGSDCRFCKRHNTYSSSVVTWQRWRVHVDVLLFVCSTAGCIANNNEHNFFLMWRWIRTCRPEAMADLHSVPVTGLLPNERVIRAPLFSECLLWNCSRHVTTLTCHSST